MYAERVGLADAAQREQAAQALRSQMQGQGFSLVEVLAPCPERWGMSPAEALAWSGDKIARTFPLGVLMGLATWEVQPRPSRPCWRAQ